MVFTSFSDATSGTNTVWKTSVSGQELVAAIPKEFNGPGGGYSPEDFYILAVTNCYIATFKVLAQNSKVDFENVRCDSTLTVGPNEKGQPEFKAVHLKVILKNPTDIEKAKRLLDRTSTACLVANSLKIEKTFEYEIV